MKGQTMATSSKPTGGVRPRCPSCGGGQFSFSEVNGPADAVQQIQRELAALQFNFEARGADIWNEFPEGAGSVTDPKRVEEVAMEALMGDVEDKKKKQHHVKLEGVQRDFATRRQELLDRLQNCEQSVAMVYCTNCGLIVGPTASPRRDADASATMQKGLAEVRDAVTQLARSLSEAFALLRDEMKKRSG